ncbi:hypothetical protein DFH07DRAFT_750074 [Mycena maculata]|uniref:Cupin 2 conserved barrel domain-containing protein n=1 Tax=Mycena maculata TaxID=230809 RepID=A0AAD7IH48_9AGAR|nr:hypothetical protein DFH07DRAFT_750074 [Mycena maculata]
MLEPLFPDVDSWTVQEGLTFTVLQNLLQTRIHVTGKGEKFYVPPHWHAADDENRIVLKGRLLVIQDAVHRVVEPDDGICFTRRGVVHCIESFPGEELILEETATAPEDQKTFFFRNLGAPGMLKSPIGVMQVMYYGDTYAKLPTGCRWLERPLVVVVGGWMASMLGYTLPQDGPEEIPSRKERIESSTVLKQNSTNTLRAPNLAREFQISSLSFQQRPCNTNRASPTLDNTSYLLRTDVESC